MKRRDIIKGLTLLPLAGSVVASTPASAGDPDAAAERAAKMAKALSGEAQQGGWTPKKELIRTAESSCLRSGHLLFIGGIGGWYANRRPEPGDIKVQTMSALTTMKGVLEAAGSSMANVLKVHMTVADPNKNIAVLNEGYRGFFPDPPPARSYSGCGVDQMGRDGILVQIDCIAYVD